MLYLKDITREVLKSGRNNSRSIPKLHWKA